MNNKLIQLIIKQISIKKSRINYLTKDKLCKLSKKNMRVCENVKITRNELIFNGKTMAQER